MRLRGRPQGLTLISSPSRRAIRWTQAAPQTASRLQKSRMSTFHSPSVDPRIPKETGCRITVEGVDDLFETYSAKSVIHPNGRLELKP